MWRWVVARRYVVVGSILTAVAAVITVYMAWAGSTKHPISASQNGLLAFVAVVAQVGGAWLFSRSSRLDDGAVHMALRGLRRTAARVDQSRRLAEQMVDSRPERTDKNMGRVSVALSVIEEGLADALDDWATVYPPAVRIMEEDPDR